MAKHLNLIGIFGGTFDPIHLGHIQLIQSLLKTGLFKKILLIPAKQNPLKAERSHVPDPLRLQMLEASLKELGDPRVEICPLELKRQGLSYTKDTVIELKNKGIEPLVLIVGNEVFREFPQWKDPRTVLSLVDMLVVQRTLEPCHPVETLKECGVNDAAVQGDKVVYEKGTHWIRTLTLNVLPYSATQIRKEIAKSWKDQHLSTTPQGIQRSVWLIIKENQLYAVNE